MHHETDSNFHVPAGQYPAVCCKVFDLPDSDGKTIRILWEIKIAGAGETRYVAGRNYNKKCHLKHSRLRKDAVKMLGPDIDWSSFDAASLVGREASITIKQYYNRGHKHPFSWIMGVDSPNTANSHEQQH